MLLYFNTLRPFSLSPLEFFLKYINVTTIKYCTTLYFPEFSSTNLMDFVEDFIDPKFKNANTVSGYVSGWGNFVLGFSASKILR